MSWNLGGSGGSVRPRPRRGPPDSGPAGAYFGHGGAAVRVLPHGRGRTVAVIGVGYVGLPTAATLAHLGHRVTCGDADPAKVAMLESGKVPIVEDHLEELVREGQAAGPAPVRGRGHRSGRGRRVRLPVRPHPPGRRRLGRPLLRRGGGQGDRSPPAARDHHRQQVDRAGGLHPGGRAGPRPPRREGRLQSGVPAGGDRRPRQPPSRAHRGGGRRPVGRGPGRRPLRRNPRTAVDHRRRHRRDHQVRLQRLPRHQAELRQRRGRPVRGGGRRRARRDPRPGLRQAHRLRVPATRARVGRELPAQGHAGTGPHRRAGRVRLLLPEGGHRHQRGAVRPGGGQGHARRWAASSPGRWWPYGASPSRRGPTTSATPRPSRWSGAWSPTGPPSGSSTRRCRSRRPVLRPHRRAAGVRPRGRGTRPGVAGAGLPRRLRRLSRAPPPPWC